MKHHTAIDPAWSMSLLLTASLMVTACTQTRETGSSRPAQTDAGIPTAVKEQVLQRGQAITAEAFGVLSSRLGKAIADAGFTNAISFCSVHGLTLTESVGVTNEVVLRRVTHKPRNPANRADSLESTLIQRYRQEVEAGETPKAVVTADRPGVYTYHAPILLNLPLCLNCHGQPGTDIQPATLAQIKSLYPTDQATGFQLGQLRGMWSIDFKRSDFE